MIQYAIHFEFGHKRKKFVDDDRRVQWFTMTGRSTLNDADISILQDWGVEFEKVNLD